MIQKPFFIVGAERSGTTLLRLMLDFHPQISCFSEFEFAVDLVGDDGRFPDMKLAREYLSKPSFRDTFSDGILGERFAYAELMDSVLRRKQESDQKEIVGATVHRHFHRLMHMWPSALYLHVVRDGRDVARSRIGMGWDGNVWTGIDTWIETEELWNRLKNEIAAPQFHEIRYEELIADPECELRKACRFLGVEFSQEMLSYPEHTTYSLPDPGLVYQWRQSAESTEIQLMEYKALELLEDRGYDPSGLPEIEVPPVDARRLERASIWKARRFRLRRYGLYLMFLDNLSRRLPFRRFRGWVEEQLYMVSLKHVN